LGRSAASGRLHGDGPNRLAGTEGTAGELT
jgi:hypothetical protein